MTWRGYHYVLGAFLLVPTAIVLTVMWAWRRLRGPEQGMIEGGGGGGAVQLRQGSSKEFTIPAAAVGYVIGRHGQRVRDLERSSGARIRFKDQQNSEEKASRSCNCRSRNLTVEAHEALLPPTLSYPLFLSSAYLSLRNVACDNS